MKYLFFAILLFSRITAQLSLAEEPLFWMAFHACDVAVEDCFNPQYHMVYLAQSSDGNRWELVPNWQPIRGSVPDVIRRGNTLYVYTARNEVVRYHLDTQLQDPPQRVTVTGIERGFVDPSLYLNENGQLVLFFLNSFVPNGDPAACPSDQATCEKVIDSAVEVSSSDGTQFVLDANHRAVVELGTGMFDHASDPDIFFDGTQYILYISHGTQVSVWTAAELQDEYKLLGKLVDGTGGVPSGYFDAENRQYWTLTHIGRNKLTVIRRAVHESLEITLQENDWHILVTGESIGLTSTTKVESPSLALNVP